MHRTGLHSNCIEIEIRLSAVILRCGSSGKISSANQASEPGAPSGRPAQTVRVSRDVNIHQLPLVFPVSVDGKPTSLKCWNEIALHQTADFGEFVEQSAMRSRHHDHR